MHPVSGLMKTEKEEEEEGRDVVDSIGGPFEAWRFFSLDKKDMRGCILNSDRTDFLQTNRQNTDGINLGTVMNVV